MRGESFGTLDSPHISDAGLDAEMRGGFKVDCPAYPTLLLDALEKMDSPLVRQRLGIIEAKLLDLRVVGDAPERQAKGHGAEHRAAAGLVDPTFHRLAVRAPGWYRLTFDHPMNGQLLARHVVLSFTVR